MLARHQVISISGTDGKLIKTNGYRLQREMLHIRTHHRLGTVKACTHHQAASASLLHIALTKGGREREPATVENIIEIQIESILRNHTLGNVYPSAAQIHMTMIGFGSQIHHIKTIAVAIGVKIKFIVLVLASQLCRIYRKAKSHSPIGNSHTERTPKISHHLRLVCHPTLFCIGSYICARQVAEHFHGPSFFWPGDVCRVESHLVILGSQKRIYPKEPFVI